MRKITKLQTKKIRIFTVALLAFGLLAAGCNKQSPPTETQEQTQEKTQEETQGQTPEQTNTEKVNLQNSGEDQQNSSQTTQSQTPQLPNEPSQANVIEYNGEDGKNALTILKSKYTVGTQEFSGIGEFVTSINGVTPDSKHFWAFYVNGKSSNIGASQYITKSTDKLEWKLETINN